jgi:hypothetical protein
LLKSITPEDKKCWQGLKPGSQGEDKLFFFFRQKFKEKKKRLKLNVGSTSL